MIVFLNGEYVAPAEARVSVWDGGFLYGDGVYTTLRTYGGRPVDLAAHHQRLEHHAAAIDLRLPVTLDDLRAAAENLAVRNNLEKADGRMRITVSRGGTPDHPLPLSHLDTLVPTVLITLVAVGAELERWQNEGIGVITLDATFARGNFPELKTLNSLATLLALRRAAAAGCPEAVLTDPAGDLLEGAVSNLFLVDGGRLLTPVFSGSFLPGLTRERILGLARAEGIQTRETTLGVRDLASAQEVFMASSVREILPVVSIDGTPVSGGVPGPVARLLQNRYRRAMMTPARNP